MLLTFKNGVSEVQSVVHPGLTDLGFFVDRIQTGLMLCPPKILQPKHSTDQRAAWLKRDSNYSHIPLPFQRKNSCHPLYSKKKKKKKLPACIPCSPHVNRCMNTHLCTPFFCLTSRPNNPKLIQADLESTPEPQLAIFCKRQLGTGKWSISVPKR